jgi:hypothetical protein
VVDEESGHVGWRNNISTEKSIQELKGQMSISPLSERQQRYSKPTPSTYMCGRSECNFCNGRYLCIDDYLIKIPYM